MATRSNTSFRSQTTGSQNRWFMAMVRVKLKSNVLIVLVLNLVKPKNRNSQSQGSRKHDHFSLRAFEEIMSITKSIVPEADSICCASRLAVSAPKTHRDPLTSAPQSSVGSYRVLVLLAKSSSLVRLQLKKYLNHFAQQSRIICGRCAQHRRRPEHVHH
jgi:hypothetical protein